MRSSYVFKLFEEDWEKEHEESGWQSNRGLEHAVAIASSAPVYFENANHPLRIRTIPVSSDPPTLRVMWSTGVGASNNPGYKPTLFWKKESEEQEVAELTKVIATTDSYDSTDLCDEPAKTYGKSFIRIALQLEDLFFDRREFSISAI